ncbi:MAG TPA: DUF4912 domain-containing protein [Pyrinomonadaceae bacterium]|nr:DUF4912 domain-containing protein [Pyrinomonadaceae bacterium]
MWQNVMLEAKSIMATTKKTVTKKAKAPTASIDPFAESVVEVPTVSVKKPVKKAAPKRQLVAAAVNVDSPVKKVRAAKKAVVADPFAEIAVAEVAVAVATSKKADKKVAVKTVAKKKTATKKLNLDVTAEIASTEPEVALSPAFKALAEVTLPELKRENRARLQMQSPTRLYFYWSVKDNPWQRLKNVFADSMDSYTLVSKLTDLKNDTEEINACDAEGNWWFDVEPDGEYQAEIGFYAVNRPYFRIIHSNTIATPRRSPSPRPATESRWTVSANKFAEVLDVAGFTRDAIDVAIAGDDVHAAETTTHQAFARLAGTGHSLAGLSADELRYALMALAAGATLEELRTRVSARVFAILQSSGVDATQDAARSALGEYFDIDDEEWTEEEFGSAVFGASLVNFPKTLRTRKLTPKYAPRYNPVSSHSIR